MVILGNAGRAILPVGVIRSGVISAHGERFKLPVKFTLNKSCNQLRSDLPSSARNRCLKQFLETSVRFKRHISVTAAFLLTPILLTTSSRAEHRSDPIQISQGITIWHTRGDFKYDGDEFMHQIRVHSANRNKLKLTVDVTFIDGTGKRVTEQQYFTVDAASDGGNDANEEIARSILSFRLAKAEIVK